MALTGGAAILARLRNQRAVRTTKSEEPPVVVIAYASQTGTAQDIAISINAECNERKIKSRVLSLNDLKFEGMSQDKTPVVISVVSTTGDGDPPDNSQTFFKDMKHAKMGEGGKLLKGVKYTCLGLGDSNYTSFMAIPLRFKKGFDELGAERFYACREVDEVDGLEDLVEEWIEGLWERLKETLAQLTPDASGQKGDSALEKRPSQGLEKRPSQGMDVQAISDSLRDFKLGPDVELQGVAAMPVCGVETTLSQNCAIPPERWVRTSCRHRHAAPVLSAKKLTAEWSDREVYEMVLDLKNRGMAFVPGDSLDILPENDPALIDALLERLQLDGSLFVTLRSTERGQQALPHIEDYFTVKQCFLHSVDVCSALKKSVLRFLAECCQEQSEADRLKFLVSKPGKEFYQKLVIGAKATLMDVLHCFPSCQPPLAGLLELLPPLMPRMYSIASSPKVDQDRVRIAFSVANHTSPYGERIGVATGWLKTRIHDWWKNPDASPFSIPVCIRSGGSFHLPDDLSRPLILIGPGTGVAPFLGFVAERRALAKDWSGTVGPCWLFFGCRRPDEDDLFKEELQRFHEEGTLAHYHVAFSRQTEKKVYVQDLMHQSSEALHRDIFQQDGFVFVCGDGAAMAQDVHKCLIEILMQHSSLSEANARDALNAKLKDLTYVKDIWS